MKTIYTAKGLRKKISFTPISEAIVRKAKEISFHKRRGAELRGGSVRGLTS